MLIATDLKNNTCFIHEGKAFKVLNYKHTHLGRGRADIKVKVRDLRSSAIKTFTFGSNDRFEEADITLKKMQYLYKSGDELFFMDPKTYEQIAVEQKILEKSISFLQEGEEVNLMFLADKVLDIDLAASVVLTVKETSPGVKGNSATNIFKPAVLENGLSLKVPLFVNPGDKIKVDTRTGDYLERVKTPLRRG